MPFENRKDLGKVMHGGKANNFHLHFVLLSYFVGFFLCLKYFIISYSFDLLYHSEGRETDVLK